MKRTFLFFCLSVAVLVAGCVTVERRNLRPEISPRQLANLGQSCICMRASGGGQKFGRMWAAGIWFYAVILPRINYRIRQAGIFQSWLDCHRSPSFWMRIDITQLLCLSITARSAKCTAIRTSKFLGRIKLRIATDLVFRAQLALQSCAQIIFCACRDLTRRPIPGRFSNIWKSVPKKLLGMDCSGSFKGKSFNGQATIGNQADNRLARLFLGFFYL